MQVGQFLRFSAVAWDVRVNHVVIEKKWRSVIYRHISAENVTVLKEDFEYKRTKTSSPTSSPKNWKNRKNHAIKQKRWLYSNFWKKDALQLAQESLSNTIQPFTNCNFDASQRWKPWSTIFQHLDFDIHDFYRFNFIFTDIISFLFAIQWCRKLKRWGTHWKNIRNHACRIFRTCFANFFQTVKNKCCLSNQCNSCVIFTFHHGHRF